MAEKSKPNLVYALDANGKPVHVDSVPKGRACDCKCPRCEGFLEARNGGEVRAHHFAHDDGADCVGAVESAIHCLAKEILAEVLFVKLPGNAGDQKFDRVEMERNYPELNLRPDCVGHYGDKVLWVEFKRTHEVDARKAGKIISARIDCIEIDLNECGQDKEKLREFITQSCENRKWIYSGKYGIGLAEHASSSRNSSDERDSEAKEKLERHFALDENGRLIDLGVPGEFDANNHSYYCPNCGKEVALNVDDKGRYAFDHIESDVPCDDEMYLRGAAVAAIHQSFLQRPEFPIEVTQYRSCKQAGKCPCYIGCCAPTTMQYDLKSLRYCNCEKDYKFEDVSYRSDLVLFRDDTQKDPIEIRVNTETFENELETSRRLIEVAVHSEYDICRLEHGLKGYNKVHYSGFSQNLKEGADPEEIQQDVWKFTIYASGKIFIGPVKCTELRSSLAKPNVLKQGFFTKIDAIKEEMYQFLLLHYKALQKDLCRCQLCWSLKKSSGMSGDYICTRYKKVGTPKTPLKEKNPPKDCPYFKMDFAIQNRERELNEAMEIVEL